MRQYEGGEWVNKDIYWMDAVDSKTALRKHVMDTVPAEFRRARRLSSLMGGAWESGDAAKYVRYAAEARDTLDRVATTLARYEEDRYLQEYILVESDKDAAARNYADSALIAAYDDFQTETDRLTALLGPHIAFADHLESHGVEPEDSYDLTWGASVSAVEDALAAVRTAHDAVDQIMQETERDTGTDTYTFAREQAVLPEKLEAVRTAYDTVTDTDHDSVMEQIARDNTAIATDHQERLDRLTSAYDRLEEQIGALAQEIDRSE